MSKYILLILIIFIKCKYVVNFVDGSWDNDVYCGRHWNDIVTPTTFVSPIVTRSALLILYTPECERRILQVENLIERELPPASHFALAKYDTKTTPNHIWYNIDDKDNITQRCEGKNCPEYLFFNVGSSLDNPDVYDKLSGIRVLDWIWNKFRVNLTMTNQRENTIVVIIRGYRTEGFTVLPGRQHTFVTYISSGILVSDSEDGFIYGLIVEPEITKIVIRKTMSVISQDKNVWYRDRLREIQEQNKERRNWLWQLAAIYLRNFKQPVLLHKFTEVGYKIRDIPNEIHQEILGFYKDNINNRLSEPHNVEPSINEKEVKCTFVYLSEDMIQKIGAALKPLLEEWSKTELELTRVYGIREYYHGNILRHHVDRPYTHVISAILVIDSDLDGQMDWELEVIEMDGNRKNITLKPGQMFFYESASLIHGRPFPFQGKLYATAFLHYKPVRDWGWDIHPDGHWYTYYGHPKEFLDQLSTPNTYRADNSKINDEL